MDWLRGVVEATAAKVRLEDQIAEQLARRVAAWRYAHNVLGLTPAEIVRLQSEELGKHALTLDRQLGIAKDTVRRALET